MLFDFVFSCSFHRLLLFQVQLQERITCADQDMESDQDIDLDQHTDQDSDIGTELFRIRFIN
jgi:hypothetical protein